MGHKGSFIAGVCIAALVCKFLADTWCVNAAPAPKTTETFAIRADMGVGTARPEVAASDTGFLVCWTSIQSNGPSTLGMRLGRNGVSLDPLPLKIADEASYPRVSSDGKNFLVAWRSDPTVWTRLVHADGTLGEPVASVSTNAVYPYAVGEIAWADGSYVVGYLRPRRVSSQLATWIIYETVFWRIGADGKFLDNSLRISGAGGGLEGSRIDAPYNLRIAGSKRGALAVWQQTYGLRGALVHSDDLSAQIISTNAWADATPVVASNDREFFVLWRTFDPGHEGISGVRIGFDGKQLSKEQVLVPRETDWPDWPAVCPARQGWLLAWMTRPYFTGAPNPYSTNATIHGIEVRRDGRQRTVSFVIEENARPFVLNAASTHARQTLVITGRWANEGQIDLIGHRIE